MYIKYKRNEYLGNMYFCYDAILATLDRHKTITEKRTVEQRAAAFVCVECFSSWACWLMGQPSNDSKLS